MRASRLLILAIVALVGLVVAGQLSGNQPERDAVAAAESAHGAGFESSRIDVGELTLHVVQAGPPDGPPVVLLHGFPEFWYAWAVPMAELARAGFRMIAPDLRGYNRSDKPREVEAYQLPRFGDDVARLIEALGHGDAYVAGHDVGGAVAWDLAIRHPERVRGLAVINTSYPAVWFASSDDEDRVTWYRHLAQVRGVAEWASRAGNWWLPTHVLRDSAREGAFPDAKLDLYRSAWDRDGAFSTMANWYRAAFRYEYAPDIPEHHPVRSLLIAAPDDVFNPSGGLVRSVPFLPNSRLVQLDTGTHWVIQEEPERIAALLAGFFAPAD